MEHLSETVLVYVLKSPSNGVEPHGIACLRNLQMN